MNETIRKVIEAIASDILTLTHAVMEKQGIGQSNGGIYQTATTAIGNDGDATIIDLLLQNYADDIEQGRAPRSGTPPPVDTLREWALKHGIPPGNEVLYAISQAIWRDGVEARPILATIEKEVERRANGEWGDRLMEVIVDELTEYFK